MNTHAEKTQQNKNQPVANAVAVKQGNAPFVAPFLDRRPVAIAQRKLQLMAEQYSRRRQPLVQKKGFPTGGPVLQRVVSVSGLYYIPTPADLVLINALNAQIGAAETAASNDVQNNPAPPFHTNLQAAYMGNPTAALWGTCVEEKLNIWAGANGWNMQNNSHGSNPDYSRMRAGTKIWADLTTAAEAGAGASHIIDKLDRKVNGGDNDANWVAADVVHGSLNPLAGGPPMAVATNGVVTAAQRNGWQRYKTYQGKVDVAYDDLMERRIQQAGPLPSYSVFTQVWNGPQRETLRRWIDGTYDAHLPDEESSDEIQSDEEMLD